MQLTKEKEEFLEKLKNRDRETISELVNKYHKNLIAGARAQKLSEDMADDAVAETWKTFFEKADNFEGRSHVRTYLFGILYNKIREIKRKMNREDLYDDPNNILEANFNKKGFWTYTPSSPEKFIEAADIKEALDSCIKGLSDNQRKIYHLKEIENYSHNEICNLLDFSMTNIKVLLHRARNQVRRCVEGHIN